MRSSARVGTVFLMIALLLAGCARTPEAKKARYLERGNRYFKQEQYREAILEYRERAPSRPEGAGRYASARAGHYQLGQLGLAFRYLTQAQQLEPDNNEVRLKLASIYVLGGRPDDATAQVEEILKKEPDNLDALVLFAGAANSSTRDRRRARADPGSPAHAWRDRQAPPGAGGPLPAQAGSCDGGARVPGGGGARAQLGRGARRPGQLPRVSQRDLAGAEVEFRTAADLAPLGSPARVRLADFYLLMRRPEDARRCSSNPPRRHPTRFPRGGCSPSSTSRREARRRTQVARHDSEEEPLRRRRAHLQGRVLLARKEANTAVQEFAAVLKSEPRMPAAHYQLALAHLRTGNAHRPKTELREVINARPPRSMRPSCSPISISRVGRPAAMEDLERVLKVQPQAGGAICSSAPPTWSRSSPPRRSGAVPSRSPSRAASGPGRRCRGADMRRRLGAAP